MVPMRTFVAAVGLCAVLGVEAAAQTPRPAQQDIRRIDVTRWVLSHGRVDDVRSKGIRTPENPRGQQVNGLSTAFRQGQAPPRGTARTVLDVVGLLRDPYRVTLDLDKDGRRPRNPQQPHPLVIAGATIPSGFTLVVAELANPLDRGVITRWWELDPRFGKGNFYATVNIPNTPIQRGQAIVTRAQYEAYTANSILFEAPDIPFPIVAAAIEGGTTAIHGRPRRIPAPPPPPPPRPPPPQKPLWRTVGWANPLELQLVEVRQQQLPKDQGGGTRIWIQCRLPRSFEPANTRWFRVAAEANSGTLIFDTQANPFSFVVPIRRGLPYQQPDETVKVTVVASSWGFVGPVPPAGPFATPLPLPPQSVGLRTWHSWGCTLGDTITVRIKPEQQPATDGTVKGIIYKKVRRYDRARNRLETVEVTIGSIQFTISGHTVAGRFNVRDENHYQGTHIASGTFRRTITEPRELEYFPDRIDKVTGPYTHSWEPRPGAGRPAWSESGTCEFSALRLLARYGGIVKLDGQHDFWLTWKEPAPSGSN